ncbi:DgyrCDS12927 [Dimorphilus gyrociliatus]|uniref:DgyrCDS12927 n=1 Tax=Dimorphilus gyrociliatus TaxID=2664684 RepID=A0A7I8W973_9ANNE|nr:DgyrCDS12927 [Dimorphilus gyrociliatus]
MAGVEVRKRHPAEGENEPQDELLREKEEKKEKKFFAAFLKYPVDWLARRRRRASEERKKNIDDDDRTSEAKLWYRRKFFVDRPSAENLIGWMDENDRIIIGEDRRRCVSESSVLSDALAKVEQENFDRIRLKLDMNDELVFVKFMKAHKCYHVIPTSSKLIIMDLELNARKAFFALIRQGIRAAPVWDSKKRYVMGLLTMNDFIRALHKFYTTPELKFEQFDGMTVRDAYFEVKRPFIRIDAEASLMDAVKTLIDNRIHRLPVVDASTGDALFVLTLKRILRYLFLHLFDMTQPEFLEKSIEELKVGTFNDIICIQENSAVIEALRLFIERKVSALPVINSSGICIDIFTKFDAIEMAANGSYADLDKEIHAVFNNKMKHTRQIVTCKRTDSLRTVMEKSVLAEVHRLIVVDDDMKVDGIISLTDILTHIILRPYLANGRRASEKPND